MKMRNKLVLKASAGTGKTYTLSLKYIIALCNDIDYKNILVMTFTKKATAEIKEKILERLEELLFSKNNSTLIENLIKNNDNIDLKINENKIKKLKAIYKDMQKNKDKIKIYTIDSFMNIIFKNIVSKFKNFTKFSTLGGETEDKKEDNSYYYKKILENVFSDKKLFEEFKIFLLENSEKSIAKYLDIIKELIENRWKYLISKEKDEKFFDKKELEIEKAPYKILEEILSFVKNDCEKDLKDCLKTDFLALENIYENNCVPMELENIIAQNRALYFSKNPINFNKFRKKTDTENKEYINNLYEKFKESLAKEIYNKEILNYERKLLNFSEKIFKIYDNLKFKERKFSFTDITLYTYMTLFNKSNLLIMQDENNKNCGVSPLFFEMLDMKIDAVFIDEFQDTSILQWKILNEIIKTVKQVICVGDEKQSIYGWRDGEKKLFENLENIIEGKTASLNKSYRSDKNIVNYVNLFFGNIPKWKYEDCDCNSDKSGYVKYIYCEKNKEAKEKSAEHTKRTYELLINEIKKLNLKSYDDIAILARGNQTLQDISNLLEFENIPHCLHKSEEIYESPVLFEFFELLKYLFLDDDLALFNFLASDLTNFGTDELEILLKNKREFLNYLKNTEETVFATFTASHYPPQLLLERECDADTLLAASSVAEEPNILEKIKNFKTKKLHKNLSAFEFIFKILTDFNFIDIFKETNNLKNILELALLSRNYTNIEEFFGAYQKGNLNFTGKINNEKSKGIELMTIHKSKGLQFKTVFYIDLDKKSPARDELKFLFNMDSSYENTEFSLFFRTKYTNVLSLCFPEIFTEYQNKLKEEEINNKYVALTRAKNNLIFISQKEDSLLEGEKTFEKGEFFEGQEEINISENISNKIDKNLTKLEFYSENQKLDLEINKSKFSLETEEKRKLGILIHYFLENIKYAKMEEIEFSKKLCYKNYISYFGKKKLDKIFSEKNLKEIFEKDKDIFSNKWDFIYSEYELYDKETKTKYRLDRIMIKDEKIDENGNLELGEVYIVDYKTGQKNDMQLENYKSLLLKNFPKLKGYRVHTKFLEFNIKY